MSNGFDNEGKRVFEKYRQAYDSMEGDPAVRRARRAIEQYQVSLESLEAPYREKMAGAETAIVDAVLARKGSVTLFGVYARYTKGRKSTSWKSVAVAMKAPPKLIGEHTKVGKPSVSVAIAKEDSE